jgi:1,2-diacylglycerol 3-alpha-glucosyltransferase
VVSAYDPAVGGVEEHVQRLATGLAGGGDEVSVLTHRLSRSAAEIEERQGILIRRFPMIVSAPDYRYSAALGRFLRSVRGRYDAVHVHSYHTLVGLNAVLAGVDRMIFTPHYHGTGHTRFRAILHKPYRLIGRQVMRHCRAIVCVSQAEAGLVRADFPAVAARVRVIPNGTRTPRPSVAALRACTVGSTDVVSVGRLEDYKRNDLLVRAVPMLPDSARLLIVGEGPARTDLQQLARELGVVDRVSFAGRISRDALDAALSSAGVVSSMSEHEAFGLSVADGLTAGARVVASDIPSHREVAAMATDPSAARLVAGTDPADLAGALRASLAAGRPPLSAQLPSWENVVSRTRELYVECGAR